MGTPDFLLQMAQEIDESAYLINSSFILPTAYLRKYSVSLTLQRQIMGIEWMSFDVIGKSKKDVSNILMLLHCNFFLDFTLFDLFVEKVVDISFETNMIVEKPKLSHHINYGWHDFLIKKIFNQYEDKFVASIRLENYFIQSKIQKNDILNKENKLDLYEYSIGFQNLKLENDKEVFIPVLSLFLIDKKFHFLISLDSDYPFIIKNNEYRTINEASDFYCNQVKEYIYNIISTSVDMTLEDFSTLSRTEIDDLLQTHEMAIY